jgi:hypothetical protein
LSLEKINAAGEIILKVKGENSHDFAVIKLILGKIYLRMNRLE